MYTSKKKFNDGEGNEEEIRNYYMSIRKYLLCRIWKVLENDIDTKWIKEHYVDTKKLLNYFNLKKFIIGNEELVGSNDSSKLINKKKFDYLETILEKYKIDIKNNKTNNYMDNK